MSKSIIITFCIFSTFSITAMEPSFGEEPFGSKKHNDEIAQYESALQEVRSKLKSVQNNNDQSAQEAADEHNVETPDTEQLLEVHAQVQEHFDHLAVCTGSSSESNDASPAGSMHHQDEGTEEEQKDTFAAKIIDELIEEQKDLGKALKSPAPKKAESNEDATVQQLAQEVERQTGEHVEVTRVVLRDSSEVQGLADLEERDEALLTGEPQTRGKFKEKAKEFGKGFKEFAKGVAEGMGLPVHHGSGSTAAASLVGVAAAAVGVLAHHEHAQAESGLPPVVNLIDHVVHHQPAQQPGKNELDTAREQALDILLGDLHTIIQKMDDDQRIQAAVVPVEQLVQQGEQHHPDLGLAVDVLEHVEGAIQDGQEGVHQVIQEQQQVIEQVEQLVSASENTRPQSQQQSAHHEPKHISAHISQALDKAHGYLKLDYLIENGVYNLSMKKLDDMKYQLLKSFGFYAVILAVTGGVIYGTVKLVKGKKPEGDQARKKGQRTDSVQALDC